MARATNWVSIRFSSSWPWLYWTSLSSHGPYSSLIISYIYVVYFDAISPLFFLVFLELNSFFVTSPRSALHLIKVACLSTGVLWGQQPPFSLQSCNCSSERDKLIPDGRVMGPSLNRSCAGSHCCKFMGVRTRSWPPHLPVLTVFPLHFSAVFQNVRWSDIDAPLKAEHSTVS